MRPRSRFLSRPALAVIILILIATPVLEFVAHRAYRDSVDGQTALVYFFIAIYAVLAILLVWGRIRRSGGVWMSSGDPVSPVETPSPPSI